MEYTKQQKEFLQNQKDLAASLVLMDLLIPTLERENKTPTKQSKLIADKSRELIELITPTVDAFYKSNAMKKETAYLELAAKFQYNLDKLYKKFKI